MVETTGQSTPTLQNLDQAQVNASLRASSRRRWLILTIEIAWVVLFSLYVARGFLDFDSTMRVHGSESEWMVSTVADISQVWREDGYIPRWMHSINRGMPTVDQGHNSLFNPAASVPALALGIIDGQKLSVLLFLLTGGAGGLALGYVLGWSFPARLLLAGLLIARGSTLAAFGFGYLQLAGQQMYFAWIMAGVIGLNSGLRPRLFVALTAIALSQILLAGNIYFILPAAVMAGMLTTMLAVRLKPQPHVDYLYVKRAVLSFAFAAGLMAVTAVSIILLYRYVGGHPDYFPEQTQELLPALQQFFTADNLMPIGVEEFHRYVFVVPWWLALALFLLLPPIPRLLYRSRNWMVDSRLWLFLTVGFFFFATMGVGVNPITNWLWETIDVLRQWRFLERMLSVAGFLLAVLVCLRFDGLWFALQSHLATWRTRRLVRATANLLLAGMLFAVFAAPMWVEQNRAMRFELDWRDQVLETCLRSIAAVETSSPAAVDAMNYASVWPFLKSGVRLATIGADYDQRGREPTLFDGDLTELPSAYFFSFGEPVGYRRVMGYRPLDPALDCQWPADALHKPDAIPYAFAAPVSVFETNEVAAVESGFSPVEVVLLEPERIALRAENPTDAPIAVVAQTIAYPGWEARINGEPAQLESVGELLGIILPPNTPPSIIEFVYHPITFFIGGLITLITSIILIGYLLRVDEHVRGWPQKRRAAAPPAPDPVLPVEPPSAPVIIPFAATDLEAAPPAPAFQRGVVVGALVAAGTIFATAAAVLIGWLLRRKPSDSQ